jgi:hypothetical protein
VRADARLLFLDTVRQNTHYTAAHYDPNTKKLLNPDSITAPGAGYLARSSGLKRAGDGFKAPILMTRTGLVLHCSVLPMSESEISAGRQAIKAFGTEYRRLLPDRGVVLVADGGFASNALRADLRRQGIIEIIHDVSHSEDGQQRAAKLAEQRLKIHGSSTWQATGLRELVCKCGAGRTERDFHYLKNGSVVPRLIGRCSTCGSITITSGQWRTAKNPARFTRVTAQLRAQAETSDEADLTFGNPFTYNDPIAAEYGKQRFSQNEGLFGTLSSRFGLFDTPGYYRDPIDFEIDLLAALCLLHAAALAHYEHAHDEQIAA